MQKFNFIDFASPISELLNVLYKNRTVESILNNLDDSELKSSIQNHTEHCQECSYSHIIDLAINRISQYFLTSRDILKNIDLESQKKVVELYKDSMTSLRIYNYKESINDDYSDNDDFVQLLQNVESLSEEWVISLIADY